MKNTRKILALVLALVMALALVACSGNGGEEATEPEDTTAATEETTEAAEAPEEAEATGIKVGVAMPTKSLQRWNQDGSNMQAELEAAGFEVDLQYADNDIPTQVSQVENMITGGCDVLVIASIDGSALTEVLEGAKESDIPVIAYDRLIMNSDAVSYYATFDNYLVGKIQGEYVRDALDLDNTDGPYNIELTTGAPDDNNCVFFFGGAMDVLNPYIDEGKLVVQSGQTERAQVSTPNWSSEEAQKRMENICTSVGYAPDGVKLDAVMCSNDSTAQGVTTALLGVGYTAEDFPVITGQDCDKPSVINMINGTQSMSVFKDTRTLAAQVVSMVTAIAEGGEPEVNDTETYDNGTGVVPSFLCEPVFANIDNYKEILIDSGYYTEDELK